MNKPQLERTSRSPLSVTYPESLPITEKRQELVAAIKAHQVVIIAGETGSGKTTQIPKMCIEAGLGLRGQIGCTQPRRIAALSVSRRIAEELAVTWGEEVGCKIRFSDKSKRDTRIKVMTDGILLAETRSDRLLSAYEVIIIDEAHERSLNIDFLIGYLKTLLPQRPDLKVIITSATIDTEMFSKAFDGAPIFEVSGRLFPVEVRYVPLIVEDESEEELSYVDGAVKVVQEVLAESPHGDVLVFMPTERDIRECCDRLTGTYANSVEILPLMGSLSAGEQERVFRLSNTRKVIVATNIAETSLTIPRIRYVIDSGLARLSRYNGRQRTKRLPIEKVAKSSARQRAGRAGRVQEGVCIRLYSEDDYNERPDFTDPEILRANLAEVILRMKAFNLGDIGSFPFLNAPDGRAVRSGYALLHELGAIDDRNELTSLGAELARLPVDPTIGRILLQARKEHTLPEAIVIAAGLTIQDPRERPTEKREKAEEAHRRFVHPDSDILTLVTIWTRYSTEWHTTKSQSQVRKFCKVNFLSYMRMREWGDLIGELQEAMGVKVGEVKPVESIKRFDGRYRAIHRSVLSGFLGQIAYRVDRNTYKAGAGRDLSIFPGSVLVEKFSARTDTLHGKRQRSKGTEHDQWIVAGEVFETSRLFARMVSRVQVPWIEELGNHLCKRTFEEPRWIPERGEVVARERVVLNGLVLAHRKVNYSRYHPREAADLFVRSALIDEGSPFEYPFIRRNRKVADKVATLLASVGKLNRIELEERLVQFYLDRFSGISSSIEFNRFVKSELQRDSSAFDCTQEYLTTEEGIPSDGEAFPDSIEIGGTTIDLHYRYEPGRERDGVTLALPLALARRIPARMLDGAIAGLKEQQISYLIRALPKDLRKKIEAIPSVARHIAQHPILQDAPLLEGIVSVLQRDFAIEVNFNSLSLDSLPLHLRPRIEVRSEGGGIVSGRDLDEVLGKVVSTHGDEATSDLGAWKDLRKKWEREQITSWDFGDLPERIEVTKVAGVPMYVYPTLRWEEDARIALRLLDAADEASAMTHVGIRKLAQIVLAREVQEIKKQAKDVESCKHLHVLFCNTDTMKEQVVEATLSRMFEGEVSYPLREEHFAKLLVTAKGRMPNLVCTIIKYAKECLELRRTLVGISRPYSGMRNDLDNLVSITFVASTPFEHFQHLPRYLRCMNLRCERAEKDPKRYDERVQQLMKYVELVRKGGPRVPAQLQWMVEEFKVSLFAQELGTQYPISAARLDKFLDSHALKESSCGN
jgi:ATP-dependent helicase HrpA